MYDFKMPLATMMLMLEPVMTAIVGLLFDPF